MATSINIWINAIKLFFKVNRHPEIQLDRIERPRKSTYLPDILSQKEVIQFIGSFNNLKHQTIMLTIYACGLRKSELINLKIQDIDGHRNVIKIQQSKGAKDRLLPLPESLKLLLRKYYLQYKPKEYLFNGQNKLQYSSTSIDKLVKRAVRKMGIKKRITAHTLRHSYATHLVERNLNLRYIQEALGHRSSKTTEIYTQLSQNKISKMISPIDFWEENIIKT